MVCFGVLKTIFFMFCIIAKAICRPQDSANAKIDVNDFQINHEGNDLTDFYFRVDTSDGFHHDAKGYVDYTPDRALVVRGMYHYKAPDGVVYKISYVADRNGFQPHGDHIPQFDTTPPVNTHQVGYSSHCALATLCGTGLG